GGRRRPTAGPHRSGAAIRSCARRSCSSRAALGERERLTRLREQLAQALEAALLEVPPLLLRLVEQPRDVGGGVSLHEAKQDDLAIVGLELAQRAADGLEAEEACGFGGHVVRRARLDDELDHRVVAALAAAAVDGGVAGDAIEEREEGN